jgi:signal transduction histidine kinase
MVGGLRGALIAPITVADQVYGALAVYYSSPHAISGEDLEVATALGHQTALAIGNARLRSQARETAVINERNRIACDLHDSVTQALFPASLTAEVLPDLMTNDPDQAKKSARALEALTRQSLAQMRAMLLELRPAALEEAGLNQCLMRLTEATQARSGLPIRLTVKCDKDLPPEVQVSMYYIAQEALNNTIRHAHATSATVSLRSTLHDVVLRVCDNGEGFDRSPAVDGHYGLIIMHERADAIGASLSIGRRTVAGTEVRVCWPLSGRQGEGCDA